ncbi:MAG: hypothetical protein PHD32_04040 [Eubacteriales bacterium]|nr:hypothetical protein [Eubacteriales bacterium]
MTLAYRIDVLEDLLARLQENLRRKQTVLEYMRSHGLTGKQNEVQADAERLESKIFQVREELETLLELQEERWEADRAMLESAYRRLVLRRPPRP